MSHFNSSLALEEINQQRQVGTELDLLVQARHLSISHASADIQPLFRVVKVRGSLTVSF